MISTHTIAVQCQYLPNFIFCFLLFLYVLCWNGLCGLRLSWIYVLLITFFFSFHAEFGMSLLLICNSNCPFGSVIVFAAVDIFLVPQATMVSSGTEWQLSSEVWDMFFWDLCWYKRSFLKPKTWQRTDSFCHGAVSILSLPVNVLIEEDF